MRITLCFLCGLLVAGVARAEYIPAQTQIPQRSLFNRIFHRTPADVAAKQAGRADAFQARQILTTYFADRGNLSRTSIPEFKKLLNAAPDAALRSSLYRKYVKHWTPAVGQHMSTLMDLSGPGLNTNQDFLIMRYARHRFFNKAPGASNVDLRGDGREEVMQLASLASSQPRAGRSQSARDFLLARYAKAVGTDLAHAQSEFRTWQDAKVAVAAASEAADYAQDTIFYGGYGRHHRHHGGLGPIIIGPVGHHGRHHRGGSIFGGPIFGGGHHGGGHHGGGHMGGGGHRGGGHRGGGHMGGGHRGGGHRGGGHRR